MFLCFVAGVDEAGAGRLDDVGDNRETGQRRSIISSIRYRSYSLLNEYEILIIVIIE